MKMMSQLPYFVFCLLYLLPVGQALIAKTESGYTGIVVAFHKSIPENTKLLLKTLALFKDSSALLYNTTKGRAFFGEITIVVPMSWNSTTVEEAISGLKNVSYEEAYGDFFREADIRINPQKNPDFEDAPYTLQTEGCFEPGQYIHLTPEFVHDDYIASFYGPRDLNIVHEWMHLRYGIFDEYGIQGDEDFPIFYFENGEIRVSSCDRDIKGYIETPDETEKCSIYNGDQISKDCNFVPDYENNTSKASIMSQTYIKSIEEFCDKDIEANNDHRHNSKAPTKQNYYCDGLSVFEVLDRHPDFEKWEKSKTPSYVSPKFRVLQPLSLDARIILVLDVSTSMGPHTKILNTAGTTFVEDQLPDGSYVGIVTYSTIALTMQELVKINSGNRKNVSGKVPNRAGGMTAIGSGLLEALNVFKRENQPTEGATLVLMTDGVENKNPKIIDVIPRLLEAKVKVNTLAFGKQASQLLESVAVATKGKTYFFDPAGGGLTADLNNIFADTLTIQADVDLQSEQIFRDQLNITNLPNHQNVLIDRELGNNTLFIISGEIGSVNIELTSPNGTVYNQARKEYQKDIMKNIIQFRIPIAESGNWSVDITTSQPSERKVELLVTSAPKKADEQPVRVHAWLSAIKLQYPDVPRAFARVTKGTNVVIQAEVHAIVTTPKGKEDIILKDDGSGADKLRNDGIYSAYFLPSDNGRYSLFARVLNGGSAFLKKARTFSRAPQIPRDNVNVRLNKNASSVFDLSYFVERNYTKTPSEQIPMDDFTRITDGGSFSVEGITPGKDKIPPNAVNDLRVLSISITDEGRKIVTLQWTSPGDNMSEGNATYLDIRSSNTDLSLRRKHFETALRFNESYEFFNDTLKPAPGNTLQKLTLFIPSDFDLEKESPFDLYFALRAGDNAGNWGNVSNIAVGHYGYSIPEPTSTMDSTTIAIPAQTILNLKITTESRPKSKKDSQQYSGNLQVAIGLSVGIISLVIICVIGWLVYRRRQRLTRLS